MHHYQSLNSYLQKRFGKKVYKLALSGPFTCPNRDGSKGVGGCIFCSGEGSGDFAESGEDILLQIERAKQRIQNKVPQNCGYICYFQAFTNTYAPTEKLRELFFPAIRHRDIVALSIATRPDCISEETLALLCELNKIKPVWVELGLQTANEKTADLINRCYGNSEFTKTVKRLRAVGIEVIVHMIIGLPGEGEKDILDTVDFIAAHDVQGIKLQLLHVLKNTVLAQMEYTSLSMEAYFSLLCKCIERVPSHIVIHRLTGDGAKKDLIAPLWSADKHNVLNKLNLYLQQHDIRQGRKAKKDRA